jgi:hypothetical protein
VTWPTSPTFPDYYSTVARAVEAHNSIIYHLWWRQSRAVGCSWMGQTKLILELLVAFPMSLAIRTSM